MIKYLALFFLFISFSLSAVTFNKEIDEFTGNGVQELIDGYCDSLTIENTLEDVKREFCYIALLNSEGVKTGYISITLDYDSWNELGTEQAYVILDGNRWNEHYFNLNTDTGKYASESYDFVYSLEDFIKIMEAKSFRFKVGNLIANIDLTKLPMSKFDIK